MTRVLDPANPDDVYRVALAMRERDVEEFTAVPEVDTRAALAIEMCARFGKHPHCYVMRHEGQAVAVVGALPIRPRSRSMLFYATPDFPKVGLWATKLFIREWLPAQKAAGVHRIECASLAGYEDMHRWLAVLGFNREMEMPNFGKRGETFVMFAWTG